MGAAGFVVIAGRCLLLPLAQLLDLVTRVQIADEDEVPRLHEAYQRALVRRFDNPGQDLVRDLAFAKVPHVAPGVDSPVDSLALF